MVVTFVVEDGTGLTDANSYISDTDADDYFDNHGPSARFALWTAAAGPIRQEALRLATQYLDVTYEGRWRGNRTNKTQSLSWPREGVEDDDSFRFDNDVLPQDLLDATSEAALRSLTEGTTPLVPDLDTDSQGISRDRVVVGPITSDVSYTGTNTEFKKFSLVDRLLKSLIHAGGAIVRA